MVNGRNQTPYSPHTPHPGAQPYNYGGRMWTPPTQAQGPARGGGGQVGSGRAAQPSVPASPYPSQRGTPQQNNVTAQFDMPEFQDYTAFNPEDTRLYDRLGEMGDYGMDLMDPGSDYFQGLAERMQQEIGESSAAQERSAALRGAYGGLGGGMGAEVMATRADISQAGLEAEGGAMADLTLAAPALGAQITGATYAPEMGLQSEGEASRRYGHGSAEGARQFGVGVGLEQQRIANERAWQERQTELERERMQHEVAMRNAYEGGGYGGGVPAAPAYRPRSVFTRAGLG